MPFRILLVPCLDARKGEVYTGFYRATPGLENGLKEMEPEKALSPVLLLERLREYHACIFGIGRNAEPHYVRPSDAEWKAKPARQKHS